MIEIFEKKKCNGCYACIDICPIQCIGMKEDFEGFKYPVVEENSCTKCNACVDVCPIITKKEREVPDPQAYACYNKNKNIRLESSSGGIFTLLSERVIDQSGVVFGATFTKDFELKHTYINNKLDLKYLRGSKYLQSEIGNTFKETLKFLKDGRKVLFSGTPCQIGGLKSFLNKKLNEEKIENLICVDFICHGVPSPKVWKKYINEKKKEYNSSLIGVEFRNKENGWRLYNLILKFQGNKEYKESQKINKYMRTFLSDICLRPSCHDCNFKLAGHISDVTLGDFWGIEKIMPEMDDDKGCSLILTHSNKGEILLKEIKKQIEKKKVKFSDALEYNSAAIKSSVAHKNREKYFKELDKLTIDELYEKYIKVNLIKKVIKKVIKIIN